MRWLLLVLAVAACKGDDRKAKKPDSPYRPLAECGVGYEPLGGWEVADPGPITGFTMTQDPAEAHTSSSRPRRNSASARSTPRTARSSR